MSKNLIDTNLIIRFLVNDDPKKVLKVESLLKDKNNTNILLDTIVAEIIWVLGSYYLLKKEVIIEKIKALIFVDSIECNSYLLNRALVIWGSNNLSFVDAYLAAVSELSSITLFTYDQKFKSIKGLKAKEP